MPPFTSILVDIDAMAAAHPALERAAELARACGAHLKIVDALNLPSYAIRRLPGGTEEALVQGRRDRLALYARGLSGIDVDVDVLRGRPSTALIQEVLRGKHDLLMRSHARDLATARPRSFGAIDMQLFRYCPCPVGAVGPGATSPPRRILVAVHANPEDEEEQQLNRKIIGLAGSIGALYGASVTLFQAWTAFGEELLRSRMTDEEMTNYVEEARANAAANLDALASSAGPEAARMTSELRKGHPEEVIPAFVVSEGIDLVVMGTVARTGIAGLVIGNTAERLLQRLLCSVLAVKPDGFRSPIQPGDA